MSKVSFLDFQYKVSKIKFLRKLSLFSSLDRKSSNSLPTFQPNIDEMTQVFDKFDSDKDGKISQMEYKAILRAIGQANMISDVPKIFLAVDLDRDGFINLKEFMEVHKKGVRTIDIQSAFRTFDMNADGKISAEDVLEMLTGLGESCTLEDCRKMVRAVDADGDGKVDIDDFMTMMTQSMKHD